MRLYELFPSLYAGEGGRLAVAFDCDDGWYDLLNHLSTEIAQIAEREALVLEVQQVKEKFGSLRFYVRGDNEAVREVIRRTERLSAQTCEISGRPGGPCRKGRTLKTLAPDVARKLGFERVGPEAQ